MSHCLLLYPFAVYQKVYQQQNRRYTMWLFSEKNSLVILTATRSNSKVRTRHQNDNSNLNQTAQNYPQRRTVHNLAHPGQKWRYFRFAPLLFLNCSGFTTSSLNPAELSRLSRAVCSRTSLLQITAAAGQTHIMSTAFKFYC